MHNEIAVTVDRHEGVDGSRLDVALYRIGGARHGEDAASFLLADGRVRDKVGKAHVDPLERRGLRIRDVARDVLEGIGLRL
jgi:hypothetical protein